MIWRKWTMAAINTSTGSTMDGAPERQFYRYQIFMNPPLEISVSTRTTPGLFNGKKYPRISSTVYVGLVDKSNGSSKRNSVVLGLEDWYRWVITVGELLARVKSIYVDNIISPDVTEDDFKVVNYKGEVLQMIPLMVKMEENLVPAVRIIINDPSVYADFPLIDIKSMYNVINRIDILTFSMCANIMGDML